MISMVSATIESEFTPKRDYKTNRSNPFRWVFSHALRNWFLFLLVAIFTIFNSIASSYVPSLIGNVFDYYNDGILDLDALSFITLQVLIFGIGAGLMQLFRSWSTQIISQNMERDTRDETVAALLGKSQTFHDRQKIGDLMTRATGDVRLINLMINPGFDYVFQSVVGIVIPIIFMGLIHPQLVVIPVIYIIIFLISLKRYREEQAPWTMKSRIADSQTQSRLNETISGMYVVRGSSEEEKEKEIFQNNIKDYKEAQVKLGEIQAKYWPILILGIFTALGILHAVYLLNQGEISLGDVVSYVLLFQLLRFPTFVNIFAILMLTMGFTAAGRLLELIQGGSEIDLNPDGYSGKIEGRIEFRNVTFGYTEQNPILQNISFTIQPGETVALVGMTGSGKTTITKLLSRLYDPQEGEILIDGKNLKDWSIQALRSQMAIVEQDIFLFSKSIRENILLGNQNTSEEEIIAAAKLANAHDFIMATNEGYNSEIGERGTQLSGGQKQRVAIARAVVKKPRILILDDASSAIDSKTEDEINKAIKDVLKGRVSFLITHRIAQIRRANKIILLDQGRILDIGNHSYLIKNSTKYREIFSVYDDFDEDHILKEGN